MSFVQTCYLDSRRYEVVFIPLLVRARRMSAMIHHQLQEHENIKYETRMRI